MIMEHTKLTVAKEDKASTGSSYAGEMMVDLGKVGVVLFDALTLFHWRNDVEMANRKMEQYDVLKKLNVASWIWQFGNRENKVSDVEHLVGSRLWRRLRRNHHNPLPKLWNLTP